MHVHKSVTRTLQKFLIHVTGDGLDPNSEFASDGLVDGFCTVDEKYITLAILRCLEVRTSDKLKVFVGQVACHPGV